MSLRMIALGAASVALMSASVASAAGPVRASDARQVGKSASQTSRASASMTEANAQEEGSGGIILGIAAAVAVGVGLYFAIDGGDDDLDSSN